ncbi:hypothetical protein [Acetanaerobacterium elongatum]|uniref:Lipoprotein n=1 Tax=Acetanaerobacterium elongatum TaxID=258515 RepID=A0A1G9XBH5_9FIRM|nr:hypothetical protein [Acetanaerobacterium elongatum]SDM94094.1 hypothetical protein SAMN05192585_10822 [Acetanaerobacterium elongatum]
MKRLFRLLPLFLLLIMTSCTVSPSPASSGNQKEQASVTSVFVGDSADISSEIISSGASGDLVDKPSINEELAKEYAGKTVEQIVSGWGKGNYVTYNGWGQTQNLPLLENWIEKYRKGEKATVNICHDGGGFGSSVYILIADGTQKYKVASYYDDGEWEFCESSVVIKREMDYIFASDVPAKEWYDKWQGMVITHTPIVPKEIEYDIKAAAPLGEITPKEAGEIAVKRFAQFYTYAEDSDGSFYAGGQYFPLNLEPSPAHLKGVHPVLHGAAMMNGHPCYIIGIATTDTDTGEAILEVINADGGNLNVSISAEDGSYTLFADSKQEFIKPV